MKAQKIVVAVLASMLLVLGSALWAQAPQQRVPPGFMLTPHSVPVQPITPTVLSDGDVGFRIVGMRGETPVGEWVVRVNGEWRLAETGGDPHFQMR
jgi:hypothetical protein